jgi:hypothetical protein
MGRRAVASLAASAVAVGLVGFGGITAPSASAVVDVTAPTVSSMSAVATTVAAGDPIVVRYAAADDLSGVTTVYATMTGPSGYQVLLRGAGGDFVSIDAHGGPLAGVVPRGAPGGTYTLTDVLVYDAAGNSTDYTQGAATSAPPGSPALLDLSKVSVTVTRTGVPDLTAPSLNAFAMTSIADRHPGEFVTWSFAASDTGSPITKVWVFLRTPSAVVVNTSRGGGLLTGQRISFWLPTDAELGTWTVTGVRLEDSAGNIRDYAPNGTGTQSGQPSLTGPSFTGMTVSVTAGAPRPDDIRVLRHVSRPARAQQGHQHSRREGVERHRVGHGVFPRRSRAVPRARGLRRDIDGSALPRRRARHRLGRLHHEGRRRRDHPRPAAVPRLGPHGGIGTRARRRRTTHPLGAAAVDRDRWQRAHARAGRGRVAASRWSARHTVAQRQQGPLGQGRDGPHEEHRGRALAGALAARGVGALPVDVAVRRHLPRGPVGRAHAPHLTPRRPEVDRRHGPTRSLRRV